MQVPVGFVSADEAKHLSALLGGRMTVEGKSDRRGDVSVTLTGEDADVHAIRILARESAKNAAGAVPWLPVFRVGYVGVDVANALIRALDGATQHDAEVEASPVGNGLHDVKIRARRPVTERTFTAEIVKALAKALAAAAR